MKDSADVVVIGMGPGGEEVAGRLAERGLDVIGIESRICRLRCYRPPRSGSSGCSVSPVDLADADLEVMGATIMGRRIVVQRRDGTETIKVARVTSLRAGTVNFNDGNKSRSVKLEAIIAVK